MHKDFVFNSSKFNLSVEKDNFINPCCFGEDIANWLKERLITRNIKVTEPDQEDWGWYIELENNGDSYFIGIGGYPEEGDHSDYGEWRIMVEKKRSFLHKLTGKNKTTGNEGIFSIIREILESETSFKDVHFEEGA
jgi:hypothetical protein